MISKIKKKVKNKEPIDLKEAEYIFYLKDKSELKEILKLAKYIKTRNFKDDVVFYFTGEKFPTISITGYSCKLSCKHCMKNMLKPLHKAMSNEELYNLCKYFYEKNVLGILITGGCEHDATVPVYKYSNAIKKIKENFKYLVVAHTGLIDYEKAKLLVSSGLDGISLDVTAMEEVTEEVYGVRISKTSYKKTLKNFEKAGIKYSSPHVTTGLYYGKLSHELESLKLIRDSIKPTSVVITALMPLKNTPMEKCFVNVYDVAKVLAIARLMFPDIEIKLGCAHSKGLDRYKIEKLAIEAGVNAIAIPTNKIMQDIKNYKVQNVCCLLPYLGEKYG